MTRLLSDVRFTPESGHSIDAQTCLLCAISEPMRSSKKPDSVISIAGRVSAVVRAGILELRKQAENRLSVSMRNAGVHAIFVPHKAIQGAEHPRAPI
jgi:hypothetical protein